MADLLCGTAVPDFVAQDCGVEIGGIIGVALILESVEFTDIENEAEWTAKKEASPQEVWILKDTRGEYPGGSPTEEEGFGKETVRVTGAEHEITVEVPGIKDNVDFFNKVNRSRRFKFAFVTAGDLLFYVQQPVIIYGKQNIPRDTKAGAFWMLTIKWQSLDNPAVYDAPVGIFE
jgi:hypothetical protein